MQITIFALDQLFTFSQYLLIMLIGTFAALLPVLLADVFGVVNLKMPLGFVLTFLSIPLFVGYPFFGKYQPAVRMNDICHMLFKNVKPFQRGDCL